MLAALATRFLLSPDHPCTPEGKQWQSDTSPARSWFRTWHLLYDEYVITSGGERTPCWPTEGNKHETQDVKGEHGSGGSPMRVGIGDGVGMKIDEG